MKQLKKSFSFFIYAIILVILSSFAADAAAPEFVSLDPASRPVRIIRDEYGVPHVFAGDMFSLYFGYGYVTAEDRLFQIEMLRRTVIGGVAEVCGKDFIELDKMALRDGYSLAEIDAMVKKLDPKYRLILEKFAAGINKKISEFEKSKGLMPVEFVKFGFMPKKWSAADVAAIYVGTMAVRYSDFSSEMDNMALLKSLVEKYGKADAMKIFDDVTPVCDQISPNTLTGDKYVVPFKTGSLEKIKSVMPLAKASSLRAERQKLAALLSKVGFPIKLGSYTYLLSAKKTASGNAILASGPQMGFFSPAYLFEVGLHSPEMEIVGTTTPCYMNIMFGMNRDLAFTATAGVGNLSDIYVEKLNPKNKYEYLYNGRYEKFSKRSFKINIKGKKRPAEVEFLRSVHGPVFEINAKEKTAYSRKRSWEGFELESMFAWMEALNSKNFEEFKLHAEKSAVSINLLAINRLGEVFHYMSGLYPIRNDNFDDRLPLPGDGSAEWLGFCDPALNPSSKNEIDGFIANWNARPSLNFRNGDLATQWGPDQRTAFIQNSIKAKDKFDMAAVHELHRKIGYADQRAYFYVPLIKNCLRKIIAEKRDATAEIVLNVLDAWNLERLDSDKNGFYDSPAVAVFDSLWPEFMGGLFADELGERLWMVDSDPSWTQSILMYYTLLGEAAERKMLRYDYTNSRGVLPILAEACERAVAKLRAQYKTGDASMFLAKAPALVFDANNFMKAPQALSESVIEIPAMNRGTENHFIELGPGVTRAVNVNPPGQSGYRAKNPSFNSAHLRDQLDMFAGYKEYKPMRMDIGDIIKNKSSEKYILSE